MSTTISPLHGTVVTRPTPVGVGRGAAHAGSPWPGWSTLLAELLVDPRAAARALATRPGVLVPVACLAFVRVTGLFAHFAPSLAPVRLALTATAMGMHALVSAAVWATGAVCLLAWVGGAPRFRVILALYLACALWPEALAVGCEHAVTAAGLYPGRFDPHLDSVTSLAWLVPTGAAPGLRAVVSAVDVGTLYHDVLLALGLREVTPGVTGRASVAVVLVLQLVGVAVSTAIAA